MSVDSTRFGDAPPSGSRHADQMVCHFDMARLWRSLKSLSDEIYEAACELYGFGPYADEQIAARTGSSVEDRVVAMRTVAQTLLEQLHGLRSEYLADQMKALGIGAESSNLKLHIGCGTRQPDGWVNIDVYPAPLSMAAGWDLPFRDASAACIVVSHLPGMLFYPIEIRKFLNEVYRVLAADGTVQIVVDERGVYAGARPKSLELAYRSWAEGLGHRTRLDDLLTRFNVQAHPSQKTPSHGGRCDVSALIHLLADERFADVTYTHTSAAQRGVPGSDRNVFVADAQVTGTLPIISARKPVHFRPAQVCAQGASKDLAGE